MKEQEHEAFGACIEKHFPAPTPPTGTAPSAVRERERLLAIMGECFQAGAAWQRAQSAPVVPEGYVLAKQTAVEMPDGSKELGYTLLDGIGIFGSADDVFEAIRELSLPIGWVSMRIDQLLPGFMLAAAPQPAAQELCNCPGGNKPEPHKHAPNCPYRAGAAARQEQGDELRRLREALEEADGHLARAQEKDDRDWARLITNNARVAIRSALAASAEGKA